MRDFVKRTLHRLPAQIPVGDRFFPKPPGGFDDVYNAKTEQAVAVFQTFADISPTGQFGQRTLDAMWPYADAYSKWVYRVWSAPKPPTTEERIFAKLVASMEQMHRQTPGYLLGGGHGIPLSKVRYDQRLDCSSSCSKALYDAGIFAHGYAQVSGQLEDYGTAGPGRYFTLYANREHVWLRLHKTRWYRFDTSPHGDGAGAGPRLRMIPRFSSRFAERHWPGL